MSISRDVVLGSTVLEYYSSTVEGYLYLYLRGKYLYFYSYLKMLYFRYLLQLCPISMSVNISVEYATTCIHIYRVLQVFCTIIPIIKYVKICVLFSHVKYAYLSSTQLISRWKQLDLRAVAASSNNVFKGCLSKIRETRMGFFMD